MTGRVARFQFTGVVSITYDPVLRWETYNQTLTHEKSGEWPCFANLKFSSRAEGGFYRSSFRIYGNREFLEEMFFNGLGRHINITSPEGSVVWEGKLFEMQLKIKNIVAMNSLKETYNNVWMRYRITGGTTTTDSTAQADTPSKNKYGNRDYVLSGGELDSSTVADQVAARVLALNRVPKPIITPNPSIQETEPYIEATCIGYYDTLTWQIYAQTIATGSQSAGAEVSDIITAKGQYVATSVINGNATSVSKVYNVARKAGDIIADIARLGDPSGNRWLPYMYTNRTFTYGPAVPPIIPSVTAGTGAPKLDNTTSYTFTTNTTSWSTSFKVGSNANRLLLVHFANHNSPLLASGATFNSVAFTNLIGAVQYGTLGLNSWYLLAPPAGTYTLTVTMNGTATNGTILVESWYNVYQNNPFGTLASSQSTGASSATTEVGQIGYTMYDILFKDNAGVATAGGSQTKDLEANNASCSIATSSAAGAPSLSMTWSWTGSVPYYQWCRCLIAAPSIMNRAVAYYYDIWNPDHCILDANGAVIPPWYLRANNWIQIVGLSMPTMKQTSTFVDDPTLFYIEECEYTDGQDIPALKNNRAQLLDVALSRLAAKSSV